MSKRFVCIFVLVVGFISLLLFKTHAANPQTTSVRISPAGAGQGLNRLYSLLETPDHMPSPDPTNHRVPLYDPATESTLPLYNEVIVRWAVAGNDQYILQLGTGYYDAAVNGPGIDGVQPTGIPIVRNQTYLLAPNEKIWVTVGANNHAISADTFSYNILIVKHYN